MHLFQRTADLQTFLRNTRTHNRSLGFVPTMGALHAGHFRLIERALQQDQIVVCSIFVNPTQFNNSDDLKRYPRTPGKDLEALARVGCTAAFLPSVEEIYPTGTTFKRSLDFAGMDQRMEGAYRPGHFTGVAQVVHRLLAIVEADRLYMGCKDFQQLAIVQSMIRQLALPVQVVGVPTVRETDGLAMSSRNALLSKTARAAAPAIYQTLRAAAERLRAGTPPEEVQEWAREQLAQASLRPEYFEIVDQVRLEPVKKTTDPHNWVICTAVWAEDVRLIDNLPVAELA